MNLDQPSRENLTFMIKEIKDRLNLVNAAIIRPEDYPMDVYEDVQEIYEMVEKKQGSLTMMELEGILQELGDLRK
ncbi:MAG: DUF1128 domain-containing protein [Firmicutes bacterium]|nr:DUF1128 domain-containing protein [Bacillota bacterium]